MSCPTPAQTRVGLLAIQPSAITDAIPDLHKADAGRADNETKHDGWVFGRTIATSVVTTGQGMSRHGRCNDEKRHGNDVCKPSHDHAP